MKMLKMLTPPVKASVISFLIAAPAFGAKIVVTDRYEIDSAEKIAAVQASDGLDIAEGAVVDYSAAADLVLTDSTPVTGSGSFVHASGGKLILLGNNSAFTGAWYITNAAVVVSNRYGLGSSATKGAFLGCDRAHLDSLHFGGAGLTNDVPLTLGAFIKADGTKADGCYLFKDNLEEEIIFNGLVSHGPSATYISTGNAHFRGGFKGLGNSPTFEPSGANGEVTKSTWIYFESQISDSGYLMLHGSNYAVQHFVISNGNESAKNTIGLLECYRGYLHCGSKNVFGSNPNPIRLGGPYETKEWRINVFDLNGFDQTATTLFSKANKDGHPAIVEEDGEKFVTEVTSAEPATLTLTAADSTTATKFTGAVSLLLKGNGKTYSLANLLSTTTGKLIVTNGANAVIKWNAGWAGPIEINDGSRLTVSSSRAFVGGMSDVTVAQGGVLEVSAGAGVSVKTLRLGGKDFPAGRYTVARLTDCGYGNFVAGEGEIVVAGSGEAGPNPMDALVFDLVLTNVTAAGETVKPGEILDGVSYSAAMPYLPSCVTDYKPARDPAGFEKYGPPELISVRKEKVVENYRYKLWVTNEMNVLHFPRNERTSEGGNTAVFAQGIRWESLPPLTSNVTFYIRYRWDGNFLQPSIVTYDQFLFQLADLANNKSLFVAGVESVPPTNRVASAYSRYGIGGRSSYEPSCWAVQSNDIYTNHWVDAFFVCERTATGTKLTAYRLDIGVDNPAFRRWDLTNASTIDFPGVGQGRLILGNSNSYFGNCGDNGLQTWKEGTQGYVYSSFAGDIAKFKIFNRALSLTEINAVLGGGGGGMTFKVGSRNGKSDEFAANEGGVADPYDPVSMTPRRMRKALDAAHPTLTLKFPLLPEEDRLAKTLRVAIAARDDVLGLIPVVLKVNGVEVETLGFDDGTDECFAFIRGPRMVRDADGNVTVTLTRPSPVLGTVFIDTIEMSGGWAAGIEDGKTTDWCFADVNNLCSADGRRNHLGVVGGERGIPYLYKQNYGLRKDGKANWYPTQDIAFDVPKEILEAQCPLTFSFKRNMSAYGQLDVSVNGTPIYHDGPNEVGLKLRTLTLPPELINPGYNVLCVSNSSCTFAESQEPSGYNSISYDFFRFSFKPPSTGKGLVLIVR